MKTIRINDETYEKIAKFAKEDRRTIISSMDILIERALRSREYTDAEMSMMRTYVQLEQNGQLGNITQK